MSPCRKRIIESGGEVDVGRRQMKRDGLRRLEMQYSPANRHRGARKINRYTSLRFLRRFNNFVTVQYRAV